MKQKKHKRFPYLYLHHTVCRYNIGANQSDSAIQRWWCKRDSKTNKAKQPSADRPFLNATHWRASKNRINDTALPPASTPPPGMTFVRTWRPTVNCSLCSTAAVSRRAVGVWYLRYALCLFVVAYIMKTASTRPIQQTLLPLHLLTPGLLNVVTLVL